MKAESPSGIQLVNDKPLWCKDTVSVLAVASITWLVIDSDGAGVDGGVVSDSVQLNGKIGKSIEFAD